MPEYLFQGLLPFGTKHKLKKTHIMKKYLLLITFIIPVITLNAQTPEEKLSNMGITLPEVEPPVANYVKFRKSGNLIFLSGHGPCGGEFRRGKLGRDLSIEEGYQAARLTGVCLLATLKSAIGDLNRVKQIIRVTGMVNSMPEFAEQPKVINGCSDLLTEVFGEKGKHTRAAIGMVSLPSHIPVEISMIAEIEE
jgi:enamine deaminase RidA (YjgF/YER057c/UK114 family)